MKTPFGFSKTTAAILGTVVTAAWSESSHAVVQNERYQAIIEALKKQQAGAHVLAPSQAPQIVEIESLTLDPGCAANDNWCGGTMTAGGQTIILPRNLLIDLPANRLTLKQIFQQAPAACVAAKQSGLARNDTCRITTKGAIAALSANHDDCGKIIAGDVFFENGPEAITGPVTFINFTDGYFRVNGTAGSDAGGVMVRMNDPAGTHSIQQGKGCLAGSTNCSPDIRFTNDPVNYTTASLNGYPLCIPSTLVKGDHTVPANANGVGDPLCPDTNRTAAVAPNFFVQDSRRFAPLKVGDSVTVLGGFVTVGGVTFLSAHTVTGLFGFSTREAADQPDYMTLHTVRLSAPDFPESHIVAVFHGLTTLPDSQTDIFSLRVDSRTNESHPDPLTSTVGNPRTINKLRGGPGGKFEIALDIHLLKGAPVPPSISPCTHLRNAGFNSCPAGGTLAEEVSIMSPLSREVQAVTRRSIPLADNVFTLDILGRQASNSQFTMPLGANLGGIVLAEPGEVNFGGGNGPLILEALPWTLDRRISPTGCDNAGCENTAQALTPYPVSGVNLLNTSIANGVPATAANRVITFFDFIGGELVPGLLKFPPASSCPPTSRN